MEEQVWGGINSIYSLENTVMYLAEVTQYNLRILQTKQEVTLDKLENYAFEIHVA